MNRLIFFIFVSTLIVTLQSLAMASPVFPPNDNRPLNQPVEKTAAEANAGPQNTSTETANLNKGVVYDLAKIDVKILFGTNQAGEKSYKTSYQLNEVSATAKKEPEVRVTYKNKADKDKFSVSEVSIKKMGSNAYQISAKVVESKPDEVITPKINYLN